MMNTSLAVILTHVALLQLPHIWRKAPRRFLWLFAGSGCEQADHALLVKSVGFAFQGRAWLACLSAFTPLPKVLSIFHAAHSLAQLCGEGEQPV
jgi:hypothetical protein